MDSKKEEEAGGRIDHADAVDAAEGKESPRSSVESKGDTAEHKTGGRSDGGEEEEATLEALDGEDVALVDRLEDYFASPEFTSAIAAFMDGAGSAVSFVSLDSEQPLENHDAFQRYGGMLEEQLGEFTRREGVSVEEVALACQRLQESGSSGASTSVDYVVAAINYEDFMGLCYDFRMLLGSGMCGELAAGEKEAQDAEGSASGRETAGGVA